MKTALWIIAVCEIVRAIQNALQLMLFKKDNGKRENAYAEFVKSLKQTDKEFVKRLLEEFQDEHADDEKLPFTPECYECTIKRRGEE